MRKTRTHRNPHGLSKKELEVLILVAKGLCNKEIAFELKKDIKTVEKHRTSCNKRIKKFFEIPSGAASLTRYALSVGYLSPQEFIPRKALSPVGKGFEKFYLQRNPDGLTDNEILVLMRIVKGEEEPTIARGLGKSVKTIQAQRQDILDKLRYRFGTGFSIATLVAYAHSRGYIVCTLEALPAAT